MGRSISWVMSYHRRPQGERDRVGGLPDHLPNVWPRCQLCQDHMEFVGQVYGCDRLPLGRILGLQLYICSNCRQTYDGRANDRLPIHMELLPARAAKNKKQEGMRCRRQPLRYISYTPIEDSMDQSMFNRRKLAEEELSDVHLRRDKVGGLFPYDGYEGPRITPTNRIIAQFAWAAVGGPIYLYRTSRETLYLFHYR